MAKRTSVTLDGADEQLVRRFADPGSPAHSALTAWAMTRGLDPGRLASDASILRALLRAGADRLDEDALDDGYAALASATDDVGRAETQAARARYAARTDRATNA